jgi:hypothetical protein
VRLLLARLRQAVPADVRATVMLDGHPAPGAGRNQRIAANLDVRQSGSASADDALISLVHAEPPHLRAAIVLVSDDRALVERARTLGARTQRLAWLEALLTGGVQRRAGGTSLGAGRPPRGQLDRDRGPAGDRDGDEDRPAWQPGRGATRKRGNPRRRPRGGL